MERVALRQGRALPRAQMLNPVEWDGRRNPEPGNQSLIKITACHLYKQGALGKSPNLSEITNVETPSPVPCIEYEGL